MFKIGTNSSIHITRGDSAQLSISAKTDAGQSYSFETGDVLTFRIINPKNSNTLMEKEITVSATSSNVVVEVESDDTKDVSGELIRPLKLWYEVELNAEIEPQTIIGYDETGPKEFIIYPEGVDSDE